MFQDCKTIRSFCDDKITIQLKDIPIIKQVRTTTNSALNGEEYEKSYVSDRLNRVGKSSSANTYLKRNSSKRLKKIKTPLNSGVFFISIPQKKLPLRKL